MPGELLSRRVALLQLLVLCLAALGVLLLGWPYLASVSRTEFAGLAYVQGLDMLARQPDEPNPYLDRALRYCQAALRWNPHYARAWRLLGEVYLTLGQNEAARQALAQAVALRPRQPLYHLLLGDAYDGLGLSREALSAWALAGGSTCREPVRSRRHRVHLRWRRRRTASPRRFLPFSHRRA